MGQVKVILPAMGEGIFEATIIKWLVAEGDTVNEDDSLVEIATDKVDSEVPAPQSGVIDRILVPEGEIAKVGQEIVILKTKSNHHEESGSEPVAVQSPLKELVVPAVPEKEQIVEQKIENVSQIPSHLDNGLFLSPLVRSIAQKEQISDSALKSLTGTGLGGRITKDDLLHFLNHRSEKVQRNGQTGYETPVVDTSTIENFEVIEMTRMRKIIAENMVRSKQISPHVTSFHEVDVTNIVQWRDKNKEGFFTKYKQKLTFTPIFIEAVTDAIREYPLINVTVDGDKILIKKQINIGMATALPDGNLIVPVIKQANQLSLSALATKVNDLAERARNRQLQPDEITGGTFTITNVGSFGNLSGTPIILQPQVAILAVGAIKKRPAVIETPQGDTIGIRHQMILSLSYDHRVIDGSLGGLFLKKIADNLEAFDPVRTL